MYIQVLNVCFLVHTLVKKYVPGTYFRVITWYVQECTEYILIYDLFGVPDCFAGLPGPAGLPVGDSWG